jgi:hypothetical protein
MAITQFQPEEQNPSVAPTLGTSSGVIGQGVIPGQGRQVSPRQKGSGRFTNLQAYIQANEPTGGGLNPNAALIQRRAQEAQRGFETARTGFETQAEQAKSGLEGIQNIQQFVGGVLQNPTQAVARQSDVQRFRNLATGQETIARPTNIFGQFQEAREGLKRQQGGIAFGLETDVGANLQNYIRSQRANPSLATQGENVLDKFIAEQAPTSIAQAEAARGVVQNIRGAAMPTIASQVEELNKGLQNASFLTPESVQQAINAPAIQEEEKLRNLNNLYLATQVGLGSPVSENKLQYNYDPASQIAMVIEPGMDYKRPANLRQATQSDIKGAEAQFNLFNRYKNNIQNIDKNLEENKRELAKAERSNVDLYDITANLRKAEVINELRNNIANLQNQKQLVMQEAGNIDVSRIPAYNEYLKRLQNTRQQLLQEYDPTTLARIQALSQLSGRDMSGLLGSGIA